MQVNETSGFGYPETATLVEECRRGTCYRDHQPLPTDLYCHDHGRFLPLIGQPAGVRVFIAIAAVLIGYGSFELTAETGSSAGVYVLYAAILLGFVAIPLRHFARTAAVASLVWLIGSVIPLIAHATPGGFHVIAAAVFVVCAAIVLAIYTCSGASASFPSPGRGAAERYRVYGRDTRRIARLVAAALGVAAWSAIAGLAVKHERDILPGGESALTTVLFVVALIAVGVGALIVSVSAGIVGVGGVTTTVIQLRNPGRPIRVTPSTRTLTRRTSRARNALDTIIETFAWILYAVVVAAGNALAVIGLGTVYCIAVAFYALACAMIAVANLVVRVAVITARWARAAMIVAARVIWRAAVAAWHGMIDAIVSVLAPVSALLGTPWVVVAAASETRRYLVRGPLTALGLLVILLLVAALLLLGAWVILANQHPRESLTSAGRSIPATIGYGAPIVLIGGWLLGILGELGYGRIRLGLVTYVLTGGAIIAVITYLQRGRQAEHPDSSPVVTPSPPAHNGRTWSASIALVMIASVVIGLLGFVPETVLPPAPTGLTVATWTTTSTTISWTAPASGPAPDRYIIEEDGKAIGSVPGKVTTYRATDLTPDTTYTYRVLAVRGTGRSLASAVVTIRTHLPPTWQAGLAGAWTAHYTNVTAHNFTFNGARLTADTWTLTPTCATGQCPVTVAGALSGYEFTATLQPSGRLYTSRSTDDTYMYCKPNHTVATLTLKIGIVSGAITRGQWVATSWRGSMALTSPGGNCTAATITASVNATRE